MDREGDDEKDISQSIEECFRQLNEAELFTSPIAELHTKFSYILTDNLGKDAAKKKVLKNLRKICRLFLLLMM